MNKAFSISLLSAVATLSVASASPAQAFIIDFKGSVTGGQPSLTFPGGPITLTAAPVSSTQGYVQATTNGLCVFANATDGVRRCGLGNPGQVFSNYDNIGISSNIAVTYKSFSISQALVDGYINPNPPGTGQIFVRKGSPNGTLLDTINLPISAALTPFTTPFSVSPGEKIFFQASGSNASIRLGELEAVPGPLPFLGAGAALGWSRRLRLRTRQAQLNAG
jgi:hypothetical protein